MGKKLIIYFRLISKCQRTLGTFSVPSWVTPYAGEVACGDRETTKILTLAHSPQGCAVVLRLRQGLRSSPFGEIEGASCRLVDLKNHVFMVYLHVFTQINIDFIYFITKAFLAPLLGIGFTFVPSSGVKKCQQSSNTIYRSSGLQEDLTLSRKTRDLYI